MIPSEANARVLQSYFQAILFEIFFIPNSLNNNMSYINGILYYNLLSFSNMFSISSRKNIFPSRARFYYKSILSIFERRTTQIIEWMENNECNLIAVFVWWCTKLDFQNKSVLQNISFNAWGMKKNIYII